MNAPFPFPPIELTAREQRLRAELSSASQAEWLATLTWMLGGSHAGHSDRFTDALAPVNEAFERQFDQLDAIAEGWL